MLLLLEATIWSTLKSESSYSAIQIYLSRHELNLLIIVYVTDNFDALLNKKLKWLILRSSDLFLDVSGTTS